MIYKCKKIMWGAACIFALSFLFIPALNEILFSSRNMNDYPKARDVKVLNPDEAVRLHVVAHSDDPREQELKNALAGELRAVLSHSLGNISNKKEMLHYLERNIDNIGVFSKRFLDKRGVDHLVSVSLSPCVFPAREYAGVLLPPGEYQALYVSIGDGGGENWWCLLFPPMCFNVFPAAETPEDEETEKEQNRNKIEEEPDAAPEIRFWFLETFFGN